MITFTLFVVGLAIGHNHGKYQTIYRLYVAGLLKGIGAPQ